MIQLNLTVKKFYIPLTICGLFLQTTVACASAIRTPASPAEYKVDTAAKTTNAKIDLTKPQQATGPALILSTKDIFKGLSRPPVEGPRTGGGGNSCALAITQVTTTLIEQLKGNIDWDLIDLRDMDRLLSKIKNTRFYLQDNLVKDGQLKDAMNFPEQGVIYVSPKLCATELSEVSGRSMSILLHEYLGLAKINDQKYQVSGKFLQLYTNGNAINLQTKAWLTNELKKEIEGEKSSCFAGSIAKEIARIKEDREVFDPEGLAVEIQNTEYESVVLDDRNFDLYLDKNKHKTEDEENAAYEVYSAKRKQRYLTLVPFDTSWHGTGYRQSLYFAVDRLETTTTLKTKGAEQTMGILSQSVKTTYKCTPFELNWEKLGVKSQP